MTALVDRLCHVAISQCSAARIQFTVQEIEQLAATLIQQFVTSVASKSIADYLTILRYADVSTFVDLPAYELHPSRSPLVLPQNFANEMPVALFQEGDAVQWISLANGTSTDTGIVIGRFLAYAYHHRDWKWKYLIWLSQTQGSVRADTAWEDDLVAIDGRNRDEPTSG